MQRLPPRALLLLGLLALAACTMNDSGPGSTDAEFDAERLTSQTWRFETVAGQPLPDRVRITMAFDADQGRAFGSAGCNRYTAGYTLQESSLAVEVAAATKMMCPEHIMAAEDRFLKTLTEFRDARIDPDTGRLELTDAAGALSTAFPDHDPADG